MRKRIILGVVIIIAILAIGALLSGRVLASEAGRAGQRDLMAVTPETLKLRESEDNGSTWSTLIGDLTLGYSMVLDPANTYEYIDIENLNASPDLVDGTHEFFFDAFRAPDGFWDYWAVKGVVEGATGWQGDMWTIISGEEPMFYLKAASGSYSLLDGYQYLYESTEAPLRVNGDYPLGTYHFGGWVTDKAEGMEYLNIQITFTKVATVSITPETSTIDGCGYVDVIIHLADVHDLYAVDIELAFDETVLEVVDLDGGEPGINLEPINTWFVAADWVYNEADNGAGTIRYVATQRRPTDPVDEEGDIARIRFRAKAIGSSDITITKAELSDRDGYLVGRPVNYADPAATITTQFTTAAGLELDISRLNSSTVQLSWPGQSTDLVTSYTLHHSNIPYFTPDSSTVYQEITNDGVTNPMTFDDAVLGDVFDNDFYSLQLTCSNGFVSPPSWQVGKFEFELFESFEETDFSWIGIVLESSMAPALENASDLAYHIENFNTSSAGSVDVLTISEWNPSSQQFTLYPDFDFPLVIGKAYQVEISTNSFLGTIWAQVGKLPPQDVFTYTLYESFEDTDFTWVLQPLYMHDITSASSLVDEIENNASPAVNVLTLSEWNGPGQLYTLYEGTDFTTRFGYPYLVEVDITDPNEFSSEWP